PPARRDQAAHLALRRRRDARVRLPRARPLRGRDARGNRGQLAPEPAPRRPPPLTNTRRAAERRLRIEPIATLSVPTPLGRGLTGRPPAARVRVPPSPGGWEKTCRATRKICSTG